MLALITSASLSSVAKMWLFAILRDISVPSQSYSSSLVCQSKGYACHSDVPVHGFASFLFVKMPCILPVPIITHSPSYTNPRQLPQFEYRMHLYNTHHPPPTPPPWPAPCPHLHHHRQLLQAAWAPPEPRWWYHHHPQRPQTWGTSKGDISMTSAMACSATCVHNNRPDLRCSSVALLVCADREAAQLTMQQTRSV